MDKETMETMETANTRQEAHQPLLRVYLCGEFRLDWQVSPATQEALWNSRTSARALFKLLLCAPGRQASRSQLAGILWPESDEGKALESLRQARNVLRKMLHTAGGEELIEQRNHGETLKLAEQARLWVDADAFEEGVAQAVRVEATEEALRLLQQAQALLTGEFLAEDQDAEWTRHRWVKQRRQVLLLTRRRMMRHLADLYMQRGQIALAEETLEGHLTRFPTDQDALYRLLLLLEAQGCLEEARLVYERTTRVLDAMGKQPAPQVRAQYERLRLTITSQPGIPLFEKAAASTQPVHSPDSAAAFRGVLQNAPADSTGGVDAPWELLRVLGEPEQVQSADQSVFSHRQLVELGIAALISRLTQLDSQRVSGTERDALSRALSQSIMDGWNHLFLLENAQVVALGRVQLALLHRCHPLIHPSALPYLYAGTHSFLGIGLHFQACDEDALQEYHHGYLAAVATGDPWYVAQSLICQSDSYHALGQYDAAIQSIQEALRVLAQAPADAAAIVQARAHLLSCWADSAMMLGDERTTREKLDQAASFLDPGTLNEEFDRPAWLLIAGKYALKANNVEAAKAHFEEALTSLPQTWLLRRVMTATGLAMACARLGDHATSLAQARELLPLLLATNAPMTNRWFTNYLRQDLLTRFPADEEVRDFVAEASRNFALRGNLLRVGAEESVS
jgi:DNA-binding SARP family transcriptional activator